jgi:hypothetical protein
MLNKSTGDEPMYVCVCIRNYNHDSLHAAFFNYTMRINNSIWKFPSHLQTCGSTRFGEHWFKLVTFTEE